MQLIKATNQSKAGKTGTRQPKMSRSPGRMMKNFGTFLALFLTFSALTEGKLIKIEENNWQDLLTGEWMVEL